MRTATRSRAAIVVAAVGLMLLSGCQQLPKRTVGSRCAVSGSLAHDGAWILRCGGRGRWTKVATIASANDAIGAWLRSQAPLTVGGTGRDGGPAGSTSATTGMPGLRAPTSAAPATTFAAGAAPVADRPGAIRPGLYWTIVPDDDECWVEVTGAATERRRHGDGGPLFLSLDAGTTVEATGSCVWTLGPPPPLAVPADGDGMYRVGVELAPGLYSAPGSDDCAWAITSSADGSAGSITDAFVGSGPQMIAVDADDAFLLSSGCGAWARW